MTKADVTPLARIVAMPRPSVIQAAAFMLLGLAAAPARRHRSIHARRSSSDPLLLEEDLVAHLRVDHARGAHP